MHHWEIGGTINIGWPDHNVPERPYSIVELQHLDQVLRIRVSEGERQGGFLVIYDCPDPVLEQLAEQATHAVGFKVIVSSLRCSVDGVTLRSFDYEWYPTTEFEERPGKLAQTLADLFQGMRGGG